MIYLDSNVFLYAILYEENSFPQVHQSKQLLSDIIRHNIQACTSILTWDEIVFVVRKKIGIDESIRTGEKFLSFPNMRFIEPDHEILTIAQDFITSYKIRPRDAIHAASAYHYGAKAFVSDDSDFDCMKEIQRVSLQDYSQ
ncbi:MAG: type II toxin-antitoxin system VapC family toxin [Methanomicrobiales archaeon]|jgi:predicted nucleic acid-binding protein|nr:type II toxin-antitoxin system VapC family toxin [Methanomicrobiales archaeon]